MNPNPPPVAMKLVPAEPTKAMLEAAVKSRYGAATYKTVSDLGTSSCECEAADDYRAMLAAAPVVAPAEPVAWQMRDLHGMATASGLQVSDEAPNVIGPRALRLLVALARGVRAMDEPLSDDLCDAYGVARGSSRSEVSEPDAPLPPDVYAIAWDLMRKDVQGFEVDSARDWNLSRLDYFLAQAAVLADRRQRAAEQPDTQNHKADQVSDFVVCDLQAAPPKGSA